MGQIWISSVLVPGPRLHDFLAWSENYLSHFMLVLIKILHKTWASAVQRTQVCVLFWPRFGFHMRISLKPVLEQLRIILLTSGPKRAKCGSVPYWLRARDSISSGPDWEKIDLTRCLLVQQANTGVDPVSFKPGPPYVMVANTFT